MDFLDAELEAKIRRAVCKTLASLIDNDEEPLKDIQEHRDYLIDEDDVSPRALAILAYERAALAEFVIALGDGRVWLIPEPKDS